MLGQMSACETIGISALYKEAATAVDKKQDPAPFMCRLQRILRNSHSEGRLPDPDGLYQALDSMLHTNKAASEIAGAKTPLSFALDAYAQDPIRQRGTLFSSALGL